MSRGSEVYAAMLSDPIDTVECRGKAKGDATEILRCENRAPCSATGKLIHRLDRQFIRFSDGGNAKRDGGSLGEV